MTTILTRINSIKVAREAARLSTHVTIEDLLQSGAYTTNVMRQYRPYVPLMSIYTATQIAVLNGAGERFIDLTFDSGNANFIGEVIIEVTFPRLTLNDLQAVSNTPVPPAAGSGLIRYCDFPGVRLFQNVSFQVNGKSQEEYSWQNVFEMMDHEMDDETRRAFELGVGQQQVKQGKFSYTFNADGAPITGVQMWGNFTDGPQTPKNEQPELTMFIPLMFNWCRNPNNLMSCTYLDPNNRSIRIKLASLDKIVSHYVGYPAAVLTDSFKFKAVRAYTRSYFVNPACVDLFQYPHKTLTRSWRTVETLEARGGMQSYDLKDIGYPIEQLFLRAVPRENWVPNQAAPSAPSTYDSYYLPVKITKKTVPISMLSITGGGTIFPNSVVYAVDEQTQVIDRADFVLMETRFMGGLPKNQFLRHYAAFAETSTLRVPSRPSSLMFNFAARYRGQLTNEASGCVNLSVFDSKRLEWSSDVISETYLCDVTISMQYLNSYEPIGKGMIAFYFSI